MIERARSDARRARTAGSRLAPRAQIADLVDHQRPSARVDATRLRAGCGLGPPRAATPTPAPWRRRPGSPARRRASRARSRGSMSMRPSGRPVVTISVETTRIAASPDWSRNTSAVAASTGSHSHTAHACRKADRANSNASACGSGLSRISAHSTRRAFNESPIPPRAFVASSLQRWQGHGGRATWRQSGLRFSAFSALFRCA